MKFAHIAGKLLYEPCFMLPSKHAMLMRLLRERATQARFHDDNPDLYDEDDPTDKPQQQQIQSGYGIAIIDVDGVLGKRLSWLEMMCGGCDIDDLTEAFVTADEDDDVHTVISKWHTPGGLYTGAPELADLIYNIGHRSDNPKRTISFCDTQCCSLGYWLASQSNEFYCTKSSQIGSINGFIAGIDSSEEWKKMGWTLELFRGKTGDLKAIGMDGKPWEEVERDFLRAQVQKGCDEFFATVRRGRGTVADDTMRGQWFDGDQSVPLNLTDGLVANLQEVIEAAMASHYLQAAASLA